MKNYKIIDLTYELHSNIPTWDLTCGFSMKTLLDYNGCAGDYKFRVQSLDMLVRSGTHMDSPSHCIEGGRTINQIPIQELIVDCVVINTSDKKDENYKITLADIELFEQKHGQIKAGSFVIFFTGWSQYWNDPKKYHNNHIFPSVSPEVATYLLERKVVGIGIDTFSPDCDGDNYPVHKILLGADKYIIENVANADKLPPVGSIVLIMPLPMQGATESPIRLVGLVAK